MPINDERRRFGRAKATPDTEPPTAAATGGTPGPKDGVQESLQSLQETLLLQRNERAEFRAEEEKRIQASEEAVRRARDERNEKYERLQQAFERVDRWKDEEKAEAAREQSKRAQGTQHLSYLCSDLVQIWLMNKADMDGFRLVGEALERYRKQRADARALLESE